MIELIASALLSAAAAQAANPDSGPTQQAADPCIAEAACRTIDSFRFDGPDGTVTEVEAGLTMPFVAQGNVLITPGESITIALVEDSGVLVPLLVSTGEASSEASVAAGQIRFNMTDVTSGQVQLIVESNYPGLIDYAAVMVTIGAGPERTSVCTLMEGVTVFEQWQAPIYQLALWGFRPSENYGCKIIDPELEPTRRDQNEAQAQPAGSASTE